MIRKTLLGFTALLVLFLSDTPAVAGWEVTYLHPAGSTESRALGVSGGQQVGWVRTGSVSHAGYWSGTAASFVDLHPAGASRSSASAVSGGYQAGGVDVHAGLWSGTAQSWEDLHGFLGVDYRSSYAYGIEVTSSDIWVVGNALNLTTGQSEAVMWHNVVPEPSGFLALGTGLLALGGLIRRRR